MNLDDQICYCYHVSLRKLIHFARRERPAQPSRMSDCLQAGTGCGWCIPILKRIHACALAEDPSEARNADMAQRGLERLIADLPTTPEDYADRRRAYITEKRPRNEF
ncbi:MAG: (2Fe-2S)-binding protein [Phycisphaerae bacterium]|nr:(2Fe-2S)-binding protein [Phycisphaerae bacterium]NUQ46702.1 (2Fe-2S)-binding protein [Phycisphaerae bacterium]